MALDLIAKQMLMIKSLDSEASLHFSEHTSQWYVSARIDTGGDGLLSGIVEHASTPHDAVDAFFCRLTNVDRDHYLVTGYSDTRRHWRWNGAAFVELVHTYSVPA